jgi:hypothetical protein
MIVFLDIDGVLKDFGTPQWWKGCINVLNTLTRDLNLKYVVTSTWRAKYSIEELQSIFSAQGIQGEIIDFTPVLCQDRGLEISEYMKDNPVTEWICLDDKISDIKDYIDPDNIYECHIVKGLTEDIGNKILKRFKK